MSAYNFRIASLLLKPAAQLFSNAKSCSPRVLHTETLLKKNGVNAQINSVKCEVGTLGAFALATLAKPHTVKATTTDHGVTINVQTGILKIAIIKYLYKIAA